MYNWITRSTQRKMGINENVMENEDGWRNTTINPVTQKNCFSNT